MIVEIALATSIPVAAWMAEPDEVIATVLDIYEERARRAKKG